ncbi:MAG: pro-sigmaK processing inhibitor BofA family protein [Clostridia bacterium]|nr:pro-sigmaK processing inhibitor BofA family protein [Clostridia bacterium]
MEALKIILICVTVLYFLVYIILAIRSRKPIKTIFFSALLGILSMTLINLTSKFTGVCIPVNGYTASVAASGGLPATVALVLVKTVIGV